MSSSRKIAWMVGAWIFVLVIYSVVSLSLKRGSESLVTFGNLVQCIVPLLANAGLLLNAGTPHWRRNLFWMLIAMSSTLWLPGFCALVHLVDFPVCLRGLAVDLCLADGRAIQLQL